MNEFIAMWKNYTNFNDRTSRKGYWLAVLFQAVIGTVLYGLGAKIGIFMVIGYLFSLASMIPGLAICVRRLHDIGKTWKSLLVGLIPCVGEIILIIWFCKPTSNEDGVQV